MTIEEPVSAAEPMDIDALAALKASKAAENVESGPSSDVVEESAGESSVGVEINLTEDGGVKKIIKKAGYGDVPTAGSKVSVHYVGTLLSGEKFDSSRDRDDYFKFSLGKGHVIKGWDIGVATMKIGEVADLICESDYAYGDRGSPPKIPPKATLKFEVELIDFEEDDDTTEGKLKLALAKKEEGNEFFKKEQFAEAAAAYQRGISTLESLDYSLSDEEKPTVDAALIPLRLNAAASLIRIKDFKKAVTQCEKVLDKDPNNLKALFRAGQARGKSGDFAKALADLERASSLDPADAGIKREIALVKKAEAEFKQKEKAMFSKMFA